MDTLKDKMCMFFFRIVCLDGGFRLALRVFCFSLHGNSFKKSLSVHKLILLCKNKVQGN